ELCVLASKSQACTDGTGTVKRVLVINLMQRFRIGIGLAYPVTQPGARSGKMDVVVQLSRVPVFAISRAGIARNPPAWSPCAALPWNHRESWCGRWSIRPGQGENRLHPGKLCLKVGRHLNMVTCIPVHALHTACLKSLERPFAFLRVGFYARNARCDKAAPLCLLQQL